MADIFGRKLNRASRGGGSAAPDPSPAAPESGTGERKPRARKTEEQKQAEAAAKEARKRDREAAKAAKDAELGELGNALVLLSTLLDEFEALDPEKHSRDDVADTFDRIIDANNRVKELGGTSLREDPEFWKGEFVKNWEPLQRGEIKPSGEEEPKKPKTGKPAGGKSTGRRTPRSAAKTARGLL